MREQLLPCPFCGGEAHIERLGNRSFSTIYRCNHCGCSLETGEEFGHGRDWNRRAVPANENSAFKIRQQVFKHSGSWWRGFVVGHYSTDQTPDGICVQLDMTNGPAQIYPASALKLVEIDPVRPEADALRCPVCNIEFKPEDVCASDIEMGICHAECLQGCPVVDLENGEELPEGSAADTFLYAEIDGAKPLHAHPAPPPSTHVEVDERSVGVGMAMAAAIVMRCWGKEVIATQIIDSAGLGSVEKLKAAGVEQYDIDALLPALATTEGKDNG